MVARCCVAGCSSSSHNRRGEKNDSGLTFHRFPSWKQTHGEQISEISRNRRMAWIRAVRRKNISFNSISMYMRVCSLHFHHGKPAGEMYTSHPDWAPSLNLGHSEVKESQTDRYERLQRRKRRRTESPAVMNKSPALAVAESLAVMNESLAVMNESPAVMNESLAVMNESPVVEERKDELEDCKEEIVEITVDDLIPPVETPEPSEDGSEVTLAAECDFCPRRQEEINRLLEENRKLKRGQDEMKRGRDEMKRLLEENRKLKRGQEEMERGQEEMKRGQEELKQGREELKRGRDEINRLLEENRNLKRELSLRKMDEHFLTDDVVKVNYYTGLPHLDAVMGVLGVVGPALTPYCKVLSPFQMLLLTLMRLRLNLPIKHVGYMFGVSRSTAGRAFTATVDVLHARVGPLVRWPDRGALQAAMPQRFVQAVGRRVVLIVDCFEISTQKPTNSNAPAHTAVVKFLIGITPLGSIAFISRGWAGDVSDRHITDHCGILDKLLPGDLVMAGRGFDLGDGAGLMRAVLKTPDSVETPDSGEKTSVSGVKTSANEVKTPDSVETPDSGVTAPVSETTAPVSGATAPVSEARTNVSEATAPVSGITAPVSDATANVFLTSAPVSGITAPVSGITANVFLTSAPVSGATPPPSTRGRCQLEAADPKSSRKVVKLRSDVFRVIGTIRNKYTMLYSKFPMHMRDGDGDGDTSFLDRMVSVCCALTNMSPSVINVSETQPSLQSSP
ncbi:uncharacterized protein LOC133424555 [Cololabis saira]|uniref:uncharacterized protein LOC133424555 n=1 Tax=Cololabis saira TaxID=129043 RepID=UPI002AD39AF2|nr:uncharacterized protein LOC133424555 [Cololabis saira]